MFRKRSSDESPAAPDLEIDFRYLWQVVRRRWRIIAAAAGVAALLTAITVFAMRPVYEGVVLLLIDKVSMNPFETDAVKTESVQEDYYQTQYVILESRGLAEKVVADLKLDTVPEFADGDPASRLRRRTSIRPVRRTRLVNVVAESRDPKLAAAIANSLAARYIEQNMRDQRFASVELLKVLEGKSAARAHESLPAVVNSPLIQQLKGQLALQEGQWAELSGRYRPAHPRMAQLKAHIAEIRSQIDREVKHIVESLKLQLSGQLKGSNVRVVEAARPSDRPAKPRKLRLILLALFVGTAIGMGIAVFVDRVDLTVHTQEDMEHFLRMPCLATIQKLGGSDGTSAGRMEGMWREPWSAGAEGFRSLRTAVSFRLPAGGGSSALLLTSAVQEEGKSFVAANLARAFAQAGEKVLLVDGDLRRPTVHRTFSVDNTAGVSDYLSDRSVAEPSLALTDCPGLTVLPCGPVPGNPAELLAAGRTGELLAWAVARFDRVIVDSSPLFPVTDALLWARQIRSVVFVVNAAGTRVSAIQRVTGRLREASIGIVGGVLNRASAEPSAYYRYYSSRSDA